MDHLYFTHTGSSSVRSWVSVLAIALFAAASVIVGSVFTASVAEAATDCTPINVRCVGSGQEYTTIQSAVTAAQPGDTVVVYAGTYAGFATARSGTAGSPITITRNGSDTVTVTGQVSIDHDYITVDGFRFTYADSYEGGTTVRVGYSSPRNNVTVKNSYFALASASANTMAVLFDGSSNMVFDNNILEGATMMIGIVTKGSGHTYSNNTIRNIRNIERVFNIASSDTVIRGNEIYGVYYQAPSSVHCDIFQTIPDGSIAQNVTIENNYIHDNTDCQLGAIEPGSSGANHSNWTWRNNIIANMSTLYLGGANFKFYNNTFYRAGASNQSAILLYQDSGGNASGADFKNNLFLQQTNQGIIDVGGGNPTWTHSYNFVANADYTARSGWSETGGVNGGNPQFTAASTNCITTACNFRIGATSAAKDKGTSIASVTVDKDGVTRPQGSTYDMGAYEYASGGGDTTPPTVSLTAPSSGATVSGNTTVSALASDNVGVAGVQFKLDGANLNTEDTTSPYSIAWNTAAASNGSHTLTAVARDATGNTTTSSGVTVTVNNGTTPPPSSASPTFLNEYETVWNTATTPKTTASFNVQAGDVLVAYAMTEDVATSVNVSGGSLTWTQRQVVNVSGYGWTAVFTAVADTNKSMTVSFARTGSSAYFGGNVLHFRNASIGASSKANVASGAPTLNLTTTQGNSAIVVASVDWTAANGSSRTWRSNAGAATETSYFRDSTRYAIYGGYHANAGPAGTYTVGLSAPGSQKYSIVAVEVKGTSPSDTQAPTVPQNLTATPFSQTQINLSWSPSTDNVGVTGYRLYRNGTAIANGNITTYNDTGLSVNTTYAYTVVAYDAAGNTSAQSSPVSTTTFAAPTVNLTAIPATVGTGDASTISWNSTNSIACTGTGFSTGGASNGSVVVTPAQTTTYSISCTGAGGTATDSAMVSVGSLAALTTIDFPSASFAWDSNGSTCTASGGWTGSQPVSGTQNVSIPGTNTYTLTCTGPSGPVQRSITVATSQTVTLSSKFTQGQTVSVNATVNVRATAGTSGTLLGTQPTGSTGTVIGGPVNANGYWWWHIDYATGADGWSVENWLQ